MKLNINLDWTWVVKCINLYFIYFEYTWSGKYYK
jgi:hypothetical protein